MQKSPVAEIADLEKRLAELDRERESILAALQDLKSRRQAELQTATVLQMTEHTDAASIFSNAQKIALFRSLFRGREDVFPRRWDNPKTGKSGYSPVCRNEWAPWICEKPRIKCTDCQHQAFVPVTDDVVESHLRGRDLSKPDRTEAFVAGVYVLLSDETCRFLAADFDKQSWQRDALAFMATCREKNVPAVLERSRSGHGAHAWIFFSEAVPAVEARRLGAHLITETMERYPDIGFESYDRLFPSQDTMPAGGFGNLIALPLQGEPRRHGNSVFVDEQLQPYEDQWAFLAGIIRMSRAEIATIVEQASAAGRIVGARLRLDNDDDKPWITPPSRRRPEPPLVGPMPEKVDIVLGNQVYIDRIALPPALVNRLIHLAAFQNPEFYAAQAMRFPTFGKPRVISCAELFPKHLALPRGCFDAALNLFATCGIQADVRDERQTGTAIVGHFLGTLTADQTVAADALMAHDTGVLAATTAFGKTVVAIKLIAERGINTLILVHRQQLLDQWLARLQMFLDIGTDRIGVVGGGKKRPTGVVDVAILQSLVRKGEVSDLVANYGHLSSTNATTCPL